MTTTASDVYADIVLLYELNIFSVPIFFDKNIWQFEKLYFHMFLLGFRRKISASRPSLLYGDFRYTVELLLQPYQIQLYTFRVQGLAFFLPWFPD